MTKYTNEELSRKTIWFPQLWQIRYWRNPNWLNSAWIGLLWSIVLLPQVVSIIVTTVFRHTQWYAVPYRIVWGFANSYLRLWMNGLVGNLHAENVTLDEMNDRLRRFRQMQSERTPNTEK